MGIDSCGPAWVTSRGLSATRALHKGEGTLAERLLQGRYTTIANTVAEAPRADLIHPGAERYMREIGVLR